MQELGDRDRLRKLRLLLDYEYECSIMTVTWILFQKL